VANVFLRGVKGGDVTREVEEGGKRPLRVQSGEFGLDERVGDV